MRDSKFLVANYFILAIASSCFPYFCQLTYSRNFYFMILPSSSLSAFINHFFFQKLFYHIIRQSFSLESRPLNFEIRDPIYSALRKISLYLLTNRRSGSGRLPRREKSLKLNSVRKFRSLCDLTIGSETRSRNDAYLQYYPKVLLI